MRLLTYCTVWLAICSTTAAVLRVGLRYPIEKWLLECVAFSCAKLVLQGSRLFWDDAVRYYKGMVEALHLHCALPFEDCPTLEAWMTYERSRRLISTIDRVLERTGAQSETQDLLKRNAERSMTIRSYADDSYGCLGCTLTISVIGMFLLLSSINSAHPSTVLTLLSAALILATSIYTMSTGGRMAWTVARLYTVLRKSRLEVRRLRRKET
jgi:hypothetical protein